MVEVKFSNLNSAQLHILADAVGEMENLGNPEVVAPKTVEPKAIQPKEENKQTKKEEVKTEAAKKEEVKTEAAKKEAPKTITKAEARELVNAKITKAIDTPTSTKIRGENNKAIKEKLAEYDVKGISDLTGDQIQEFKDFVNTLQDVK